MNSQDALLIAIVLMMFGAALAIILAETRPLWATKTLAHQGRLLAHQSSARLHFFTFWDESQNQSIMVTLEGWLWKTYLPLNRTVSIYTRGGTILVQEWVQPVVTG